VSLTTLSAEMAEVGEEAMPLPVYLILTYVFCMIFMLGAQWIVASRQPTARVDSTHVPASSRSDRQNGQ